MKKWHKRKKCKECGKFKTWGGRYFLWFKVETWAHDCECGRKSEKVGGTDVGN